MKILLFGFALLILAIAILAAALTVIVFISGGNYWLVPGYVAALAIYFSPGLAIGVCIMTFIASIRYDDRS
jgi:hypothetical protein